MVFVTAASVVVVRSLQWGICGCSIENISWMLQVSESSDRLKRERWMDQKAKKIKDQTVRSLESEVQKIMNRLDNMFENSPKNKLLETKPFLTVQTRLWAEWTEGSKQTKLGRTRSSPKESVPEAIRPSKRTFHLFSDLSFFKSYTTWQFYPCFPHLILFLKVKNEAERDKKEAAEQEKLFQLERFGQKILLF